LKIEARFVRSAAAAADLPRDGLPELALVGRSNVGKSTLINALVRQRLARTSAAPGKTRLANIYRVARGAAPPFHLVDLPGYGFARGGSDDLLQVVNGYFNARGHGAARTHASALLIVDSRHPGMESDRQAWAWLNSTLERVAIVATKIDKLSRAERLRATAANEAVFEHAVLPVSADTGEGLEELWKLIDRLLNSSDPRLPRNPPRSQTAAGGRRQRRLPKN
jgi:GTP-binding protein